LFIAFISANRLYFERSSKQQDEEEKEEQ